MRFQVSADKRFILMAYDIRPVSDISTNTRKHTQTRTSLERTKHAGFYVELIHKHVHTHLFFYHSERLPLTFIDHYSH